MSEYIHPVQQGIPVDDNNDLRIIEGYLSDAQCDKILSLAEMRSGVETSIGNIGQSGVVERAKSYGFVAERIDMPEGSVLFKIGQNICIDIYKNIVPKQYGVTIKSYESPHILRYTKGGTYGIHSDSHNFDPSTNTWKKVVNRDYSSILYLNSDFTGGEISFPSLNIRVTPAKGMLVTFPSDDKYIHTAEPTLSGVRYAFVTWAAMKGVKGVPGAPRGKVVRLK